MRTSPRRVGRRWLINALNYLNFHDGDVLLTFRNTVSGSRLTLPALPAPSVDHHLCCTWRRTPPLARDTAGWELLHLHLADGLARFEIPADEAAWDERSVRLTLPESAYDTNSRRLERHPCRGVRARIGRGATQFEGRVVDVSADSFSVLLPASVREVTTGEDLLVELIRRTTAVFHAYCRVIRCARRRGRQTLVLQPYKPETAAPEKYRCLRPRITPLPLIVFRHPLTGRQVSLRALDVSGAGFSVEEEASRAQLLPGLLLPRVSIELTSGFEIPCSARVLHHEPTADGGLRAGLAIESISLRDHTRLTALLHLGEYRNTSVCTPHVDLEALWAFFFETGFIYPEKYAHIKDQKAHFLRLYRRLYTQTPQIARHIIYQERGAIRGHVSMFRWYPRTWLLHHHAALTSARHKAGLVVMEQMLRYINEFHRLFPRIIRYIACYYRRNNRFAARTFGDAALSLRDRRRASLDDFAYFHLPKRSTPPALPAGWSLAEARTPDRAALQESYLRRGGGLMIEGLALRDEDIAEEDALSREYARLKFTRDRRLYALRRGGRCTALIAVNLSDVGLNLSDLTNGLQAFVLEPEELPVGVLLEALAALSSRFASGETTVLLHPKAYADERGIACDKEYTLGVLDLHYFTPYLDYIEGLISHEPAAAPRPSSDTQRR